jgi:hypothetical protein
MSSRVIRVIVVVAVSVMPLLGQPGPVQAATSTGTLYGLGPSSVVTIDPTTGSTATFAQLPQIDTPPGAFFNNLVSDAAGHRLFTQRGFFGDPPDFMPHFQIVTIDTSTAGTSLSNDMASGVTSLVYDPNSGSLFGQTNMCCPFQMVRIDPATGVQTHVADIPGVQPLGMVLVPSRHSIYFATEDFKAGQFQPFITLVTIDTVTGAVSQSPQLSQGLVALVYDSVSGDLFGKTFCCPASLVRVNPASGAETAVAPGLPIGPGLAIDPATHNVYMAEDVFTGFAFYQLIVSVNDQTGATSISSGQLPSDTYVGALAFHNIVITPAVIASDLQAAIANRAITNPGVAASLQAELDGAAGARARGDCSVSGNLYNAFINDVTAQTGRSITQAAASQLVTDAKLLIANCP